MELEETPRELTYEEKRSQRADQWLKEVGQERDRARALGYTLEHDLQHGPEHLLYEALQRLFEGHTQEAAGLIISTIEILGIPEEPKCAESKPKRRWWQRK